MQVHEPSSVTKVREQVVRDGEGQDGGDAAAQHVLDRGPVPQEEPRHPLRVSPDPHVHLRLCLLSEEEQPVRHIRGKSLVIKLFPYLTFTVMFIVIVMFRTTKKTWRRPQSS